METVASYIIRIYRCEEDRPKSLVGIVTEAGKDEKKVFQSYDELWEILNSEKSKRKKRTSNIKHRTSNVQRPTSNIKT